MANRGKATAGVVIAAHGDQLKSVTQTVAV